MVASHTKDSTAIGATHATVPNAKNESILVSIIFWAEFLVMNNEADCLGWDARWRNREVQARS